MPSWIVAVIQLGYASDWTGHPEKDNPRSAFNFSVCELFRFFVLMRFVLKWSSSAKNSSKGTSRLGLQRADNINGVSVFSFQNISFFSP
jgi:hypothetical protein